MDFELKKCLVIVIIVPWTLIVAGVIPDEDFPQCRTYNLSSKLHVDCSDLGLLDLPQGLNYQAQVLDLSNNNFVTLPQELQYFTLLEELNLSGNHLSDLSPSHVRHWNNLQNLNLSSNNFETWTNYGLTPTLRQLDLSKNKINTVDEEAFKGMMLLHFLSLSENRIYDLPPRVFAEAYNLNSLILSRNYFSMIPNFQSSSLRSLDLSSCQIASLSADSLAEKSSLLEIDLSINQIEFIPDNFASNRLQELKLSYNVLNTLSDRTFSSLPHLAVLHLRGNDFREVWPSSIFASNPFLREVHVKGNRWSCEGFSVNLLLTHEYLTREPAKVGDKASLICYTPANVTQLSWQEAYIKTWHPEESYVTLTWVAVMIGIIIGVLFTSIICRGLMSFNKPEPERPIMPPSSTPLNINGSMGSQARMESVVVRIPLRDDMPPTYDEALLMPRLNASFQSLPNFIEEENHLRGFRRSRSFGDLVESRPRSSNRRSIRPHRTVEINIE